MSMPDQLSGCADQAGPLRAVVVDDDPLARRVVCDQLGDAGIEVVATASNGEEAVECALRHRPDVVLMDVVMPGVDGLEATRRIVGAAPEQVVILLTRADDDDLAITGLRAGASGFLTKDLRLEALPQALQDATRGIPAVSRDTTRRLIEHLRRTPSSTTGLRPVGGPLTDREWEIVDLIAENLTNEQIARRLVLSVETVRSHVKNILRKLGLRSRFEAATRAGELRAEQLRPWSRS